MDTRTSDPYPADMPARWILRLNKSASSRSRRRRPRPAVLCILDGWGCRPDADDNAIARAQPENYLRMLAECAHARLATAGRAVGLPAAQMGNSEVGHMNIGAGRIVVQDLPRIDDAIADRTFASRPALLDLIAKAKKAKGTVHILGLVSPGGVHSHQDHIVALVRALSDAGLRTRIHAFLDGRDTPPRSAQGYLHVFESAIAAFPNTGIATVCGRYFAMDRDQRWDRVAKAYETMVAARGVRKSSVRTAISDSYRNGVGDEFLVPAPIDDYRGMKDGDALLFANFRADRARELSVALLEPKFSSFARSKTIDFSAAAGMTEYSERLKSFMKALFPPEPIKQTIGEVVAKLGLRQLQNRGDREIRPRDFFPEWRPRKTFPGRGSHPCTKPTGSNL